MLFGTFRSITWDEGTALGRSTGLLDLRSLRVVPVTGGGPAAPIPYAETYSRLLEDAQKHKLITLQRDPRSGTYVVDEIADDAA